MKKKIYLLLLVGSFLCCKQSQAQNEMSSSKLSLVFQMPVFYRGEYYSVIDSSSDTNDPTAPLLLSTNKVTPLQFVQPVFSEEVVPENFHSESAVKGKMVKK